VPRSWAACLTELEETLDFGGLDSSAAGCSEFEVLILLGGVPGQKVTRTEFALFAFGAKQLVVGSCAVQIDTPLVPGVCASFAAGVTERFVVGGAAADDP
jgi:hypothetical protein